MKNKNILQKRWQQQTKKITTVRHVERSADVNYGPILRVQRSDSKLARVTHESWRPLRWRRTRDAVTLPYRRRRSEWRAAFLAYVFRRATGAGTVAAPRGVCGKKRRVPFSSRHHWQRVGGGGGAVAGGRWVIYYPFSRLPDCAATATTAIARTQPPPPPPRAFPVENVRRTRGGR